MKQLNKEKAKMLQFRKEVIFIIYNILYLHLLKFDSMLYLY